MAKIPVKDLPAFIRKCWDAARRANTENRKAEIERLRFYVGGDLQWRDEEITKRKNSQRPWITINRCKPAVDQIEGDIRLNPPGPECMPVGGGADKDTADIIEGLIRETEYRSNGETAYATAGKYVAASGYGVIELATEYSSDRDYAQRLVINSVEDPSICFFDPSARKANRQDASWAGKLKMYSESEYKQAFGDKRKILKPRATQSALGWIQDAIGVNGDLAQINEWTGNGKGPYYVCEFYMVEITQETLRLYSDQVARYDGEPIPPKVKLIPGDQYTRVVPRRQIKKYVVDAFELLDETDWYGSLIPLFPVLGPETYIEGKLHRLSLIAGAMDAQRALNFVATTATELAGAMPKSPWIGPMGTFDDPRWQTANSEVWAYLEYKPVFVTDETTGAQTLAQPPQRNQWEAPIQWLLALGTYFSDQIKAVTAIYDPSLGQNRGDQSGKAIEQLRSESAVGNYSYADNLHRAIEVMYQEMCIIFPKILDGPRAVAIIRADSQHENVEINKVFGEGGTPPGEKANNLWLGQHAVRVKVGPDFATRNEQTVAAVTDFIKMAPETIQVPGIAAKVLRLIGKGNPEVEGIADLLSPPTGDENASPQQLQGALQQEQLKSKQLMQLVQQMHQEIQAKLPEIQAKTAMNALDNLTTIHVAEVAASKDLDKQQAEIEAAQLEQGLGMAHEAGTQATAQQHETDKQVRDQAHASQSQAADHQQASNLADKAADAVKQGQDA